MIASFVVDASAILSPCFEDEDNAYGQRILDTAEAGAGILVPAVWPLEVGNGLLMAERRGRIKTDAVARFLFLLKNLDIELDRHGLDHAIEFTLPLAREYGLTAYDAAYLEVALRRDVPLASLDRRLVAACKTAGGSVLTRA